MNRVFWVRHGENRANLTNEFSYKKIDYPLTSKGVLQAEQTADYFASYSIDAVFSSPLKRARGTADIIAARVGQPVTVVEEFREINVGWLEGSPPTAENWTIHDQIITDWWSGRREAAFPGGENGIALGERVKAGFYKVLAGRDHQNIVIAGHSGCILFSLVDLLPGEDVSSLLDHELCNGGIAEFLMEVTEGRILAKLVLWDETVHLSGLAVNQVYSFVRPLDSTVLLDQPAGED